MRTFCKIETQRAASLTDLIQILPSQCSTITRINKQKVIQLNAIVHHLCRILRQDFKPNQSNSLDWFKLDETTRQEIEEWQKAWTLAKANDKNAENGNRLMLESQAEKERSHAASAPDAAPRGDAAQSRTSSGPVQVKADQSLASNVPHQPQAVQSTETPAEVEQAQPDLNSFCTSTQRFSIAPQHKRVALVPIGPNASVSRGRSRKQSHSQKSRARSTNSTPVKQSHETSKFNSLWHPRNSQGRFKRRFQDSDEDSASANDDALWVRRSTRPRKQARASSTENRAHSSKRIKSNSARDSDLDEDCKQGEFSSAGLPARIELTLDEDQQQKRDNLCRLLAQEKPDDDSCGTVDGESVQQLRR